MSRAAHQRSPQSRPVSESSIDYRQFITQFYTKFNTEKANDDNINAILETFEDYDVMLIKLFEKYECSFDELPTERARVMGVRVAKYGWESLQKL